MPDAGLNFLNASLQKDAWWKISTNKRAGVLAPLFSLRTRNTVGIADFADLKMFIDWCCATGNSVVQLLPMNEVGAANCPYDSISSFAIEPMYCSLSEFSHLDFVSVRVAELKNHFAGNPRYVNYAFKNDKLDLLRQIFLACRYQQQQELQEFKKAQSYWIQDYALFKALKFNHNGAAWFDWPEQYRMRDQASLDEFTHMYSDDIEFFVWLQFVLHKQFAQVHRYAASKNILLKGDLPILVSRDSADVWRHPEFFKLDLAAGAPPDLYCSKGQRWGMPTYNWEQIERDGFRYVKEKFYYAQNFYDLLRIDHVVGLFRIWSIPYNDPHENQGLHGFFDPRDEHLWKDHGRRLLQIMLQSSSMLLCAEDLGIIPHSCTQSLLELGIPGNDVSRWVKDWDNAHTFLSPEQYRVLAVAMLSTHDTTNWAAWWEYEAGTIDAGLFERLCQNRFSHDVLLASLFNLEKSFHGRLRWKDEIKNTQELLRILGKPEHEVGDFISLYLNTYGEKEKLIQLLGGFLPAPEHADALLIRRALNYTFNSNALLCINTLVDYLYLGGLLQGDSYQYRINTPGTVSPANWSLLMSGYLEDLFMDPVSNEILNLIKASGRYRNP